MTAVVLLAAIASLTLPSAILFLLLRRYERDVRAPLYALAAGAVVFVPTELAERWIQAWASVDEHARGRFDLAPLLYALLVAAPLEQGLKVAVTAPLLRARRVDAPVDRVVLAMAVALGFVSAHNVHDWLFESRTLLAVGRGALAVPAHVFCAALWGYALGRDRRRRFGGTAFNVTFFVAMLFNGIYDHIVFGRSAVALLSTIPLLAAMSFVAYAVARDLRRRHEEALPEGRRSRFSIAPPSIGAVRAALRRTERPIMLIWIAGGALVTTGVLASAIGGAVAVGHRIGIDFAAVDRGDQGAASAAPLVLLGAAALLSFPFAGFLVARASAARSVLEPAIASALAIAGCLVLLGLAAPVAVVFALAMAPVAFGLACGGAWIGMAR